MSSYANQADYETVRTNEINKANGHTVKTVKDMNEDDWTCYTTCDGQKKAHYTQLSMHQHARSLGFLTPYPDGSVWLKY